jgi:predicted negative regulator of RcsB-dependent stress response
MAKRKRSAPRLSASTTSGDDALTAAVLTFVAWARERTRTLIVGGVVLTVLAMATALWFYQRSGQLDAAAGELEELQQTVAVQDPATAAVSVQGFLDRFGGTPHEIEARLLLARVHLIGGDDPNAAVEVLQLVAPNYGSPLNVDATFMLAAALEQGERWIEAIEIYEALSNRVDLSFQRKEAAEGLARARLAQGDTAAAIEVYRSILEATEEDDPERPRYEMRLAEFTAAQR